MPAPGLNRFVQQHWQRVTWLTLLLAPLAAIFGLVVRLRRRAYAVGALPGQRLPVPVVVAGNISVGGTGKTPLALWLVEALRERGMAAGIVSRGYRGGGLPMQVHPHSDPARAGDEPVMLATRARCPVFVGKDRAAAARALLSRHPGVEVIVCDDGLQHYRLLRDLEIAVIDAGAGFGNGWLLPAGPLREPPARLDRVDAVVVNGGTRTGLRAPVFSMRLEGTVARNLRVPGLETPLASLSGTQLHAVAGIGNPQRYFGHLRDAGLSFTAHAFPDHHPFTAADLDFGDDHPVLMTEKDAIKCRGFARSNWWMLPVSARIEPDLATFIIERLFPARGR